jgi:hypothetical protein
VDISFSHKPSHFPAFLSYLSTNILDFNGKAMLKGTSVEDRDLSDFLVDAKWDKKNLLVKGITRDAPAQEKTLLCLMPVQYFHQDEIFYSLERLCVAMEDSMSISSFKLESNLVSFVFNI